MRTRSAELFVGSKKNAVEGSEKKGRKKRKLLNGGGKKKAEAAPAVHCPLSVLTEGMGKKKNCETPQSLEKDQNYACPMPSSEGSLEACSRKDKILYSKVESVSKAKVASQWQKRKRRVLRHSS